MDHVARIEQLVGKVRWRLRLQTALRRGLVWGAGSLLFFAVSVLLVKLRVAPPELTVVSGVLAGSVAAAAALSGLVRRLDDIRLAATLDEAGGLHSRLGNALAFARRPDKGPFHEAAIADAEAALTRARPVTAAPWQWATFAGATAICALALAVTVPTAFALHFPVGWSDAHGLAYGGGGAETLAYVVERADLESADKTRLSELADVVDDELRRAADDEIKRFLGELNELIRALQENKLTPEEAFSKLAALDKAKDGWSDRHAKDLDSVAEQLQKAARKKKRAHKDIDPFLEALRKQHWKEAAEALERADEKAKDPTHKARDKRRVAKDLKEISEALKTARQREHERAKKERDRLKKQQDKERDRFSKRNRDRLKRKDRELEQLRREQEEMSEAMRQLERLQRDLDQAAADMLRRAAQKGGGQQASADDLKKAAEMLRRLSKKGMGKQQMRVAEGRMVDLKEMLRRAGQGKQGEGKDGSDKAQQRRRFAERAGGQQGPKGGEKGGQKGEGQGGDKGDKGEQITMLTPGGKDGMVLLGPGAPGGRSMRAPTKGQGGERDPGTPGDGVGMGHDRNLLGEKEGVGGGKYRDDFVAGIKGDGHDESRVLWGAATKGFTSARYRKVHQDYTGVVEDALDRQRIPPGKRAYVRRYFDLIRPR